MKRSIKHEPVIQAPVKCACGEFARYYDFINGLFDCEEHKRTSNVIKLMIEEAR